MNRTELLQRRRRAREIALQLVFEMDLRPALSLEEAFALYPFEDEEMSVREYAYLLVQEVIRREVEIDAILREVMVGWRPERMVSVDRAAIRLAIAEGVLGKMVPIAVAISEVVELTKVFGTDESSRFVNGVLGKIARSGCYES